jgi:hypothetical protein
VLHVRVFGREFSRDANQLNLVAPPLLALSRLALEALPSLRVVVTQRRGTRGPLRYLSDILLFNPTRKKHRPNFAFVTARDSHAVAYSLMRQLSKSDDERRLFCRHDQWPASGIGADPGSSATDSAVRKRLDIGEISMTSAT